MTETRRVLPPTAPSVDVQALVPAQRPEGERWLPVTGYEGYYEVSDRGRVRSVTRSIPHPRGGFHRRKGRLMKPKANDTGHMNLRLSFEGQRRQAFVHVMALEAFRGPRPDGMHGCHNDGDPANNHLSNLRWDTPSANQQDMVRHGRSSMKRKTHCPCEHKLVAPNLTLTRARLGYRSCMACAQARFILARDPGSADFRTLADERYRIIMAGVDLDQIEWYGLGGRCRVTHARRSASDTHSVCGRAKTSGATEPIGAPRCESCERNLQLEVQRSLVDVT